MKCVCVCVHRELTEVLRQLPASVSAHHSLVIHVTLVSYQQHLGVVPRVRFDLSRPASQHSRQSERQLRGALITMQLNVSWSLNHCSHRIPNQNIKIFSVVVFTPEEPLECCSLLV